MTADVGYDDFEVECRFYDITFVRIGRVDAVGVAKKEDARENFNRKRVDGRKGWLFNRSGVHGAWCVKRR